MSTMATKHTIEQGESLLSIAYDSGFDTWKRVWDDPANAELRERRQDAQALFPGDELTIPEKQQTPEDPCPVDKIHRFRLTRPRAWLNLRMLDRAAEPLAGARYELEVDGRAYVGETDEGGLISVEIRPTAESGRLRLWTDAARPIFDAPVLLGHLDPHSTASGLRARLTNLGLDWTDDTRPAPLPDCTPLDDLRIERAHTERRKQ